MGFEPTISWFVVRRLIHWATRPVLTVSNQFERHHWKMLYPRDNHRKKIKKLGSCDGRVVKALDLKSNGIFPRRFEPYSQRYFAMGSLFLTKSQPQFGVSKFVSCDGRVVKAFDSKSNGIFPRRFESYSQRWCVLYTTTFLNFIFSISMQNWPRWGSNPQSSDSKSDALSIGPRGRCSSLDIFDSYLSDGILHHNECKSGFGCVFGSSKVVYWLRMYIVYILYIHYLRSPSIYLKRFIKKDFQIMTNRMCVHSL